MMRTVTIDKHSWHYRLLRFYNFDSRRADDLCAYTRGVLGALCLTLIMSSLVVALTVSTGHLVAWLLAMLVYWQGFEPDPWAAIVGMMLCIALIIGTGFVLVHTFLAVGTVSRKAYSALPEEQKVSLSDWWASFREKVCFRVDYL